MTHLNESYLKKQEHFLKLLSPEEQEFHARLFRIENTSMYFLKANHIAPTLDNFKSWLNELPEDQRINLEKKGFKKCKNLPSFLDYLYSEQKGKEKRWMQEQLTKEDYQYYIKKIYNPIG